jgi:hypothetical protein
MENKKCTLSITSARPDAPFLDLMVRHIVKKLNYPFIEKVLVMDTAPLARRYLKDKSLVSVEEFKSIGNKLLKDGIISRVDFPDYSNNAKKSIYSKHLRANRWETHDFRGTQVLGTMQQIEKAEGEFFLHFDSDVLIYQKDSFNWIRECIKILDEIPEVIVALPRPGPPGETKAIHQEFSKYEYDKRGFYKFNFITSRRFLIKKEKFNQILPFAPLFMSWKRRFLSEITRQSSLLNWEQMASEAIKNTSFFRADLETSDAWTLHAPDHGMEFCRLLPAIIRHIESGEYPLDQAGHYDLKLESWGNFIKHV